MRAALFVVFAAIYSGAYSEDPVELQAGDDLPIILQTISVLSNVATCFLQTPQGTDVQIMPVTGTIDAKYLVAEPNIFSGCGVTVKSLTSQDSGLWRLYAEDDQKNIVEQSHTIVVAGDRNEETSEEHISLPEEFPDGNEESSEEHNSIPEEFPDGNEEYSEEHNSIPEEFPDGNEETSEEHNSIPEEFPDVNEESSEEHNSVPEEFPVENEETSEEHNSISEENEIVESEEQNIVPEETPDVEVSYLNPERYETEIGGTVTSSIILTGNRETVSCHILAPNGKEYDLVEGAEILGVKPVTGNHVSCGVEITVQSEEFIGNWVLIAKETNWLVNFEERRLIITVYAEEMVDAFPNEASIAAETDFYVRLEKATDLHETCHVVGPSDADSRVEPDTRYVDTCGFVIKNLKSEDSGIWQIVYGTTLVYRALVVVNVEDSSVTTEIPADLTLTRDRSANLTLGAADTVYCILEDPSGLKVFQGFGQCQLSLPSVTLAHDGFWTMHVGSPGKVLTTVHRFSVSVVEAEPKATVTTSLVVGKPSAQLSCKVASPHPVTACKFRDPSGRVLLASQGVGEDRFSFYGAGQSFDTVSGIYTHDCGINIAEVDEVDLGLWRCALETAEETYYGHISVLCPWAMMDPEIAAAVVAEPTLTADREEIIGLEGEELTMGCSVQSAIRYCYFRATNGSIFTVGPETSATNYEYAGAGFDAGECSIRFSGLAAGEGGRWSCHIGFPSANQPEQRAVIEVEVQEHMVVRQYLDGDGSLVVEGRAFDHRALDYCRFVRIDGTGFTHDALPAETYASFSELTHGVCGLRIRHPNILELHPWTVVAQIRGLSQEITGYTPHSFNLPGNMDRVPYNGVPLKCVVAGLIFILVAVLVVGLLFPKKNRKFIASRVTFIRQSFRSSIRKEPLPQYTQNPGQTKPQESV